MKHIKEMLYEWSEVILVLVIVFAILAMIRITTFRTDVKFPVQKIIIYNNENEVQCVLSGKYRIKTDKYNETAYIISSFGKIAVYNGSVVSKEIKN